VTRTFATLFSGGELAGVGMQAAGWAHLWGVEFDAAIANVAHMNGFEGVVVADVRCVDYAKMARPDHLHASPVCKNASVANSHGRESEQDMETAEAVCRAIRALLPDTFTLENVFGYRKFRAYQVILRTLCENDYEFEQHHLNSADFGGMELCPYHATFAGRTYPRVIAQDIANSIAMMLPDAQATHLAKIAVDRLGKATKQACAASAIALLSARSMAAKKAKRTTDGQADAFLTSEVMLRCAEAKDTCANIALSLRPFLEDLLPNMKWCTIAMETRRIIVQKMFGCIQAIPSIQKNTTPNDLNPQDGVQATNGNCSLCRMWAVPQTRMRLILRATRVGRLRPLEPTHRERVQSQGMFGEFEPLPSWIGWYAAIEDLIPTLPESKFAPWQLMRLPSELTGDFLHITSNTQMANPTGTGMLTPFAPANTVTSGDGARPRAFLADCVHRTDANLTARPDDEPAHTIKSSDFRRPCNEPKAFLLDCQHTSERTTPARERSLTVRVPEEPTVTMLSSRTEMSQKAFIVDGKPASYDGALSVTGSASPTPTLTASQEKHPFRAWLDKGKVVSMTPRALARFQSVPDTYELPANKKLACTVIGNGVPSLMMQRIAESLR